MRSFLRRGSVTHHAGPFSCTRRCRHEVFANFFGDKKPKCETKCDVCSDSKFVEQQLNFFSTASVDYHTAPRFSLADVEDSAELYGGGRSRHNV